MTSCTCAERDHGLCPACNDTVVCTDDGDYLTYAREHQPEVSVKVSRDSIVAAAFVARDWHGGQWSALYRLQCGNFDYETIQDAAAELARAIERYPVSNDETYDADAIIEANQALADLESVNLPA